MVAALSVVAAKAVDLARVVKAVAMAKIAVKVKKFIMASLLLSLATPKTLEMALKEVHQKGVNPSIKDLENREIRAKASDLYRFSAN